MSAHSVAEARNHLSDLIDRAMKGEPVVITRHGTPVVEIKAVGHQGRPMTKADVDWLMENIAEPSVPDDDPVSIVERMRDDDAARLL